LNDECKLKQLVLKLKEFIIETSKGRLEDFIKDTMTPDDEEESSLV
jgi:hypothetical protein